MNRRTILIAAGALLVLAAAAFFLLSRREGGETRSDLIEALTRPAPAAPATRPARRSRTPSPPPSPAALPALVRDTSWQVRLRAASTLAERTDIPAGRRAELLLEALDREVADPASGPAPAGSYLPLTGVLRLHYMHMIGDLGPDARAGARAAARTRSGTSRDWAAIAWGATGDPAAAPMLREALRTSRDADVRMSAAHYLGRLQDRSAIADLKAALADPATATVTSDVEGPPQRPFRPVREQAARALRELGVPVERRGDVFTAR